MTRRKHFPFGIVGGLTLLAFACWMFMDWYTGIEQWWKVFSNEPNRLPTIIWLQVIWTITFFWQKLDAIHELLEKGNVPR